MTGPAPVVVTQDGTDLLISGTAVDLAGNQQPVSVTINRDSVPAAVAIDSPQVGSTGDQTMDVAATVSDNLSGIAGARCNGVEADIDGALASCDAVPLRKGRNSIIVTVIDLAGNSSSASVRLNRAIQSASIQATPGAITLVSGQSRAVRVVDDSGVEITPSWTTSDDLVADVLSGNVVTATGTGTVTLTATLQSMSTTVEVTVIAGTVLPAGTREWGLAAVAGSYGTTVFEQARPWLIRRFTIR